MNNKDILAPAFDKKQVAALEELVSRLEVLRDVSMRSYMKAHTEVTNEKLSIINAINKPPRQVNPDILRIRLEEIINEDAPDMVQRLMNTISHHFSESNAISQKFAYLSKII